MTKKPIQYNTNLAAEFHVLSTLHRLGAEATLTLGNKKSVDIVVVRSKGDTVTIDVKGLAGTTSWPVDNLRLHSKKHFIVFVCFLNQIDDPTVPPEVYIVPSSNLERERLVYHARRSKRKVVPLGRLRQKADKYRNAWYMLLRDRRLRG